MIKQKGSNKAQPPKNWTPIRPAKSKPTHTFNCYFFDIFNKKQKMLLAAYSERRAIQQAESLARLYGWFLIDVELSGVLNIPVKGQ